MKADPSIIALLNKVLTTELTSINQYFLHARMYRNWGLQELNERNYKKSIKDMKQADKLMERILFLDGLPHAHMLGSLRIGEATEEMLQCDMDFQLEQLPIIKDAIAFCESAKDFVSRDLLEEILEYEEEHIDWIETQLYQIEKMGIENYLAAQITEGDD
ncbi:bacterioferritin [Agarivorans gilvus]|jgi:bacterioferritin|uniref:Bacterioferritin n=1 Tax=Agarivorans gilvus TaxID=680279 RepID=A0ABQ1I5P6_9ALTE|nr:bacterioferritin [Agarivorans gilvus]GGB15659.1 bacterioferritin [Agarivorans gilvus]